MKVKEKDRSEEEQDPGLLGFADGVRKMEYGKHVTEVDQEKVTDTTSRFIQLPAVYLIRVLKLLSEDFTSVRNLSHTCKFLGHLS